MEDENDNTESSSGLTNINLENYLPLIMEDENDSSESSPGLTNINLENSLPFSIEDQDHIIISESLLHQNSPRHNNINLEDSLPLIMEDQNLMSFGQASPNPQNSTSSGSCHILTGKL